MSYRWLFGSATSSDLGLEGYYNLPLPWWLLPLDMQDLSASLSGKRSNSASSGLDRTSKSLLWRSLKSIAKTLNFFSGRGKAQYLTIRSLLKDSAGNKSDLPYDCYCHFETRGFDSVGDSIDLGDVDDSERARRSLPYSKFPRLAPRIKALVDYMETQKPRGFLALWRDKRDSNIWYTFWAAVIFGLATLVLALASLVISSAQTWAAFKALDYQIDSGSIDT
jgi:hypothetical protein